MNDELNLTLDQRLQAISLLGYEIAQSDEGKWYFAHERREDFGEDFDTVQDALEDCEDWIQVDSEVVELDACQRVVARIAALEAQLAARKQADDLVDALAGARPMDAVLQLANAGIEWIAKRDVADAWLAAMSLALAARAAREQAVRDVE